MIPANRHCDSTAQVERIQEPSSKTSRPDRSFRSSVSWLDFRVGQDTPSPTPIQESFARFSWPVHDGSSTNGALKSRWWDAISCSRADCEVHAGSIYFGGQFSGVEMLTAPRLHPVASIEGCKALATRR